MWFRAAAVFRILPLAKRKLGLSGRNTRHSAALREGKVHSMMYTRQDVRWMWPEGRVICMHA